MRRSEFARERVLDEVRVLELIDQDVEIALRVVVPDREVLGEELQDVAEQVVEVDGAVSFEAGLVPLVDAADDLLEVGACLAEDG